MFYGGDYDWIDYFYFIKIGVNEPIALDEATQSVSGYIITNDTAFIYGNDSETTKSVKYSYSFNDLENPEIDTIAYDGYFWPLSFLDDYYYIQAISSIDYTRHDFLYSTLNGLQELDPIYIPSNGYTFQLSYYQYNNNKYLLITGLNVYTGDIIQIYTEGLPSTGNDILNFSFAEQTDEATINSTNHTVEIEVANGTNLANLVATFTLSENATAYIGTTQQTSGTIENDFSNSVTYIIEAENSDTQDWTITVTEATVGINSISKNGFSIYPNPTNGKINIETQEQIEQITIIDITGKTIIETTNTEIDLSKQKIGTYFLKIETENGIFTEKIIVE